LIGIYKITNKINGKSYIGQSVNIQRRFNAHKSAAFNLNNRLYNSPLYRAIRKYGVENFNFEILEECKKEELNDKEIFYINKYETHSKNGYNQDDGGNQASHYTKLSDELVSKIIERLKTSLDNSDEIGEDFGVTGRTVRGINSGECCYRESEKYPIRQSLSKLLSEEPLYCRICGKKIFKSKSGLCRDCYNVSIIKYPNKTELEETIKKFDGNFAKVGRYYGVSDNAVRKWCKHYKMSTHSSDYRQNKMVI
jgi:group I intron endonuclease